MAQVQASHRQGIESTLVGAEVYQIKSAVLDSRLGLIFALVIGMTAIVGSVACILYGHEASGSILGVSGLTGLVGTFIYGSRQAKEQAGEKQQVSQDAPQ